MLNKVENKTVFLKENIRPSYVENAMKYLKYQELYKDLGISLINPSWMNMSEENKNFFKDQFDKLMHYRESLYGFLHFGLFLAKTIFLNLDSFMGFMI